MMWKSKLLEDYYYLKTLYKNTYYISLVVILIILSKKVYLLVLLLRLFLFWSNNVRPHFVIFISNPTCPTYLFAGERGFWIYKMTEGVQSRRDEKLCFFWYSYNIEKQIHHSLANVLNAIECPCDHRLLRFDPRYAINRFDKINRILCYASMTLGTNVVSILFPKPAWYM